MNRILVFVAVCTLASVGLAQQGIDALSGTQSLDWPEEDLSARMMDGAHQFVERKIAEAARDRGRYWKYDATSAAAYEASIHQNRQRLREIIGAVDPRLPPRMERFADDVSPVLVGETPRYRIYQVRWAVLDGVDGEGLLVDPKETAVARVVREEAPGRV